MSGTRPDTGHRAAWLLLLTALLWSLGGVLLKAVHLHPMAEAGYRCLFALVAFLVWMRPLRFIFTRLQVAAAIAYALTLALFVIATDLTTAANAIVLQYTAPIYVALAARWVLGEHGHRWDWAFIGLALGGIALCFGEGLSARRWLGDAIALGSSLSFAAMVLLLRKDRAGSPESSMLLGNILVALVAIPWYFQGAPAPREWLILGILGIVQIGIPYLLYAIVIRRVTALEAILIPTLEPILNPIWVALVQGEIPGALTIIGAFLVITAVVSRGILLRKENTPA